MNLVNQETQRFAFQSLLNPNIRYTLGDGQTVATGVANQNFVEDVSGKQ